MTKILFIDDENRKSSPLVRYFELVCGWQVRFAATTDDALRAITDENCRFDLVLLDVMMPPGGEFSAEETQGGMNTGLRLLERLATRYGEDLKVIVYTARRDLEELEKDARVLKYVQKPLTARELASIISEIVSQ